MNIERVIAVRTGKTVYRDGNRVIKVFDSDYSKADVLTEALNCARVEQTGLDIAKILDVTMIDGKWAILSEYIEGKPLDRLMKENPEKKDSYLEQFVDLQLDVHSRKSPLLNRLKDKVTRKIQAADLDATVRYDLYTRLEAMPKHNKVCHGDFNPSNIILTPDGKPYILDWSHATQGNASADAAQTYLLFCLSGEKETAEQYLTLYCEKSRTAKKYVQSWLPIVAAAQSSAEGMTEKREFLLSWVNVMDYE